MPKRKANMRKRFFEKIETGSNKGKSRRLWTQKAQRLSKNVGNIVETTKAPPEYLMEIGAYSKAEPYSPLAEKLQKSLDRQKKIQDIAMMIVSPVSKKKAGEKTDETNARQRQEIVSDRRTRNTGIQSLRFRGKCDYRERRSIRRERIRSELERVK